MTTTLREQRKQLLTEAEALAKAASGRQFTAGELARVEQIKTGVDDLDVKIAKVDDAAKMMADLSAGGSSDLSSFGVESKASSDPLVRAWHAQAGEAGGAKAVLTPAGATTVPVNVGIVAAAREGVSLVPLIASAPLAESDTFTYLRQTVRTNAAAIVATGATKPTSTYTLDRIEGRAVTIAHLSEPVPRQWLADVANLNEFLSAELSGGVAYAVEDLILNGDPADTTATPGILTATGVRAQAFDTDELVTTRSALTMLAEVGEIPTAFVFTPEDWQTVETLRDANGRFVYSGAPQQAPSRTLWGLPVVLSTDLTAGTALTGDFRTVALLVREGIRIDWSESGAELFDTNQIKFRAESRVGLAILRPGALATVDLMSA